MYTDLALIPIWDENRRFSGWVERKSDGGLRKIAYSRLYDVKLA